MRDDSSASELNPNADNAIETEDQSTDRDIPDVIEYSAPPAASVLELSSSNQVDSGRGIPGSCPAPRQTLIQIY